MRRFLETTLITAALMALISPVAYGIPAMSDTCGAVTWEGECDGHELVWCEEGQLLVSDCSELGGTCGWVEEQGFFDCVEVSSGCAGETFAGRCDGNSVIWCEEEVAYEVDCGSLTDIPGAQCGYNCEFEAYDCASPGTQVSGPTMCSEDGGAGFGDSDTTGASSSAEEPAGGTSGGCASGGEGHGPAGLLLGLMALYLFRGRRQLA